MDSKPEMNRFELGGEGRFQVRDGRAELAVRVDGTERVIYFATRIVRSAPATRPC